MLPESWISLNLTQCDKETPNKNCFNINTRYTELCDEKTLVHPLNVCNNFLFSLVLDVAVLDTMIIYMYITKKTTYICNHPPQCIDIFLSYIPCYVYIHTFIVHYILHACLV